MVKWSILKDEVAKMHSIMPEVEKTDETLKIVEEILEFNKKIQSGGG